MFHVKHEPRRLLSSLMSPVLVLAPMEGLTDAAMRHVLTQISHYDWCVSEFLRITDRLHPARSFLAHCPEMQTGWRTAAGTPVHLQLLGSDAQALAENAARAAELGAPAIDLNFGCPARTVNRHRGGAALLAETALVHELVSQVRRAVPADVPVSAKIRLGIDNADALLDNAAAVHDAGASWITIHARTRAQGYRPPVDWLAIGHVRQRYPDWTVIANGDIRSAESLRQCAEESGCTHFMLGRAAVSEPDLVQRLRHPEQKPLAWAALDAWQASFLRRMEGPDRGCVGRYKQWLAMTTAVYPEAAARFQQIKQLHCRESILALCQ